MLIKGMRQIFNLMLLALVGLGGVTSTASAQLTAQDFGHLPLISDLDISPDGKTVALFQPRGGSNVLVIFSLTNPGDPKTTAFGDFEGFSLRWINNDYVLVTVAQSSQRILGGSHIKTRETRMISVHKDGTTTPQMMLEPEKGVGVTRSAGTAYSVNQGWFQHRLPHDNDYFLAGWYENNYRPLGVFRVSLRSGKGRAIYKGNNETDAILLDMDGEVRFRMDAYNTDTTFFWRDPKKFWHQLANLDSPFKADHNIEGFDPGGRTGYVSMRDKATSTYDIFKYDFERDQLGKKVFGHPEVDVDYVITDVVKKKIIGVQYTVDQPQIHFMDADWQRRQALLDQTFPNMAPHIVSSSDDRTRHIVSFYSPFLPDTYYLFDEKKMQVVSLGTGYPTLKSSDLAEVAPIVYEARDGTKIKGYLTLPNGKGRQNLPMIVMPHGGPQSRDVMRFDYMAQYFAYMGYAVFQPNFRGSDGYGSRFANAGKREWGGLMSDDVTDGVNKLVQLGVADRNRMCIVGGSYGGYAALIGAVLTPDLYQCAISLNGVSDLLDMLDEESKGNSGASYGAYDYWRSHIGDRFKDREKLIATSPARQAGKIKAPILLLHSTDDRSVPVEQSEKMAAALKDAGKVHKLVIMEGGDHFLLTEDTRVTAMTEMGTFLKQHLH